MAVWTYALFRCDPRVDAVVDRYHGQVVGAYWPPQSRSVKLGYQDLEGEFGAAFERVETPAFEMSARWDLGRLVGYLGTWSAARRWSADHGGADPLDEVAGELAEAWGPADRERTLRWRLSVLAGR